VNRRVTREVAAGSLHGLDVLSGEHSGQGVRLRVVLDRLRHSGPCIPRGAAADRVDDHERGALRVLQLGIDFLSGAHFFDAELSELLAHWGYESFVVHGVLPRFLEWRVLVTNNNPT